MDSRRDLERRLSAVRGFEQPRLAYEQYQTPAPLAASLLHLAALQGDLQGRPIVDLGTGTGILAIGAALRGAPRVIGIERDAAAIAIARANESSIALPVPVTWVRADAARAPLCPPGPVTVVMNPPFGAQRGHEHADRGFLETAAEIAAVSYSIHNANSEAFVDAFARDHGGTVTHAFASTIPLDRQFPHHDQARREIDVEAFRIAWTGDG